MITFPCRAIGVLALLGLAACNADNLPSEPVLPQTEPQSDIGALPSNSWVARTDMPTGRHGLATAVVNGVVYAIGGYAAEAMKKVEAYHPSTSTLVAWRTRASLPSARYYTHGAAVIGGKIYVPGGLNASFGRTRTLFRYDPATNIWTNKADLPRSGFGGVSVAISGKLYVYVPYGPQDDMKAALYRYDPSTDTWTERAKPPAFQLSAVAGVIDGKMYVAGGRSASSLPLGSLTVYNPATDMWSTKPAMSGARVQAAGGVIDGWLYVAGGYNAGSIQPIAMTEVYNPATNTWSAKAPMLTPRYAAAGAAAGGRLYVIGGALAGGNTNPWTNDMYVP